MKHEGEVDPPANERLPSNGGLLTPAAEAGSKRVEQGDREREDDRHGGGEPA